MKKVVSLVGILFTMSACSSEVDITKYPDNIQNCYNNIYYHSNNCNKDKVILKYCQCFSAKVANINNIINDQWNAGPRSPILSNALANKKERMLDKAADECTEKTGYTRVSQCKK